MIERAPKRKEVGYVGAEKKLRGKKKEV